jgi:transposase, IS6 family
MRRHLRPCRGSWHVDETYVRIGGGWRYLYRAVDVSGQTIDFLLSAERDLETARRFFRRALGRSDTSHPRTIITDRLVSYRGAVRAMKRAGEIWRFSRHRRGRRLNNWVERDRRRVKRRTAPMLGFKRFATARRTIAGMEPMMMLRKAQVSAAPANDMAAQGRFVASLFNHAA